MLSCVCRRVFDWSESENQKPAFFILIFLRSTARQKSFYRFKRYFQINQK